MLVAVPQRGRSVSVDAVNTVAVEVLLVLLLLIVVQSVDHVVVMVLLLLLLLPMDVAVASY